MAEPALEIPDEEDLNEMDNAERGYWEERLEHSFPRNATQVRQEIEKLRLVTEQADEVIRLGAEAKLSQLKSILNKRGSINIGISVC